MEYIEEMHTKLQPILSIKGFERENQIAVFESATFNIICSIPDYRYDDIEILFNSHESNTTLLTRVGTILYHMGENCTFKVNFHEGEITIGITLFPSEAVNLILKFITDLHLEPKQKDCIFD